MSSTTGRGSIIDPGFPVDQHGKMSEIRRADEWHAKRMKLLDDIMQLFRFTNKYVAWLLGIIWVTETYLMVIHAITTADRLITSSTIMTLIGGTIVQVGAIALGAKDLFKKD